MDDHDIHNINTNEFCVICGFHTKGKIGLEAFCNICMAEWKKQFKKRKDLDEQIADSKKSK